MSLRFSSCIICAFFLCCFCSCQKELSRENGLVNNQFTASADSGYLSKQTFVNRTAVSLDTGATYYHFDAQKRVASTATRDLGSFYPYTFGDSTVYFYAGSDTLPFKSFSVQYNSGYNDSTERYLYFNSARKLIRDSIIYSSGSGASYVKTKQIANYSYAGNSIYRDSHLDIIYDPNGSAGLDFSKDTILLDSRGNALELREYGDDGAGNIVTNVIQRFTYDQKPSPYVKLNINYIFPVDFGADYFYSQTGCRNNRLTWREENVGFDPPGGVLLYNLAGEYTYLPAGYPSLVFDPGTAATDYERFLYEYRVL